MGNYEEANSVYQSSSMYTKTISNHDIKSGKVGVILEILPCVAGQAAQKSQAISPFNLLIKSLSTSCGIESQASKCELEIIGLKSQDPRGAGVPWQYTFDADIERDKKFAAQLEGQYIKVSVYYENDWANFTLGGENSILKSKGIHHKVQSALTPIFIGHIVEQKWQKDNSQVILKLVAMDVKSEMMKCSAGMDCVPDVPIIPNIFMFLLQEIFYGFDIDICAPTPIPIPILTFMPMSAFAGGSHYDYFSKAAEDFGWYFYIFLGVVHIRSIFLDPDFHIGTCLCVEDSKNVQSVNIGTNIEGIPNYVHVSGQFPVISSIRVLGFAMYHMARPIGPLKGSSMKLIAPDFNYEKMAASTGSGIGSTVMQTIRNMFKGKIITNANITNWFAAFQVAENMMNKLAINRTSGSITILGCPLMQPGKLINIHNVSNRINGQYLIKSVSHSIQSGQFSTTLEIGSNCVPN